jgi:ATP-dependent phosphofructokinase / diphosphate-dependent phosphofructokinase
MLMWRQPIEFISGTKNFLSIPKMREADMRIGILTGGGDCSALNAAINGAAKTLITANQAEIIGIEDGFLGLIEERTRPLTLVDFSGITNQGGTILGTCNKASPFQHHGENVVQAVVDYYHRLQLDGIIALGGDGTMSLCHALSAHGLKFVGVPKTIDNDLMCTDRSFGFDSAVSVVAESVQRLQTTAKSHHRVMIIETMGRYSGWIALYGGVAGDADIILMPEYPYHLDEIVRILKVREQTHSHTVIVVAEGAMPFHGQQVVNQTVSDSPDPIRLGGIGKFLHEQIAPLTSAEIRTTVLGHVQRGGHPSAFDQIFATNLGCYAARMVLAGEFGSMVRVHNGLLGAVPLSSVANQNRKVPEDDMTLVGAVCSGVSVGEPELAQRLMQRNLKEELHSY